MLKRLLNSNKAKKTNFIEKLAKKKSAVPEYIWYISLIIIAITLVVGIVNITKKANKNVTPPSNLNVQFDVTIDPNNVVRIKTLDFIGSFDLEKDAPNLYLCCGGSCKNMMELFLADKPEDLFVRKATGSVGLKDYNGLILGKNGKAMLFDGKTGYIEMENPITSNDFTIVVWIYPNLPNSGDGYYHGFIGYQNGKGGVGLGRSPSMWYNPWGGIHAWITREDNKLVWNVNTGNLDGYKWQIVVMKKLENKVWLYKNSEAIPSSPWNLSFINILHGDKYWVGKVDNYFNGTIDEVRIYNRALSDEEIKQCFLGNCPNDNSLVLYLDFDDCTAKDKSGHGNDGTIHGNVTCVDEGILSGVQLYYPRQCFEKGAIWQLYYGDPKEGGVMLAQDKVDRKWDLN
jgi:hypothetical protein